MSRFPASGSGLSTAYTYVQDGYPNGAEEGESLYHVTEDRAYVFDGDNWVEQTVTDHGELSGVSEGDHRTDAQVSNLAPVDDVNGQTGSVSISGVSSGTSNPNGSDYDSGGTWTLWNAGGPIAVTECSGSVSTNEPYGFEVYLEIYSGSNWVQKYQRSDNGPSYHGSTGLAQSARLRVVSGTDPDTVSYDLNIEFIKA